MIRPKPATTAFRPKEMVAMPAGGVMYHPAYFIHYDGSQEARGLRAEGRGLRAYSGGNLRDNLRMPRKLAFFFTVLALVLLRTPTRAQQPGGQPQGAPAVTFQAEVNYVDVDTIVTDQQGNFISDLKREDFELLEDGKPQKIDTFSLIDIPVERQDQFLVSGARPISDVRTNRRPFEGHLYVIVLDDIDVSPMRSPQVRRFAREFVEKHFG